jgi:hypothetical protein
LTESDVDSIFNKNYSDERIAPFSLDENEIRPNDGVKRLFINTYIDMGDSKTYQGQVKAGSLEKDGVGI